MMILLIKLFLEFFKIGAFTFGGGYAMLPLMEEVVLQNDWMAIEPSDLTNFIAIAESTPGPVAINMATYIGMETAGWLGAIVATCGVVLPSFAVILIVARFYHKYKNSFIVHSCLTGLRPVVIGLIASAVISLGGGVFFPSGIDISAFNYTFFCSLGIFAIILILALKKVSPIILILISAVMGIAVGYAEKLLPL